MDNLMAIIQDVDPANNLNRFADVEENIKQVRKEFVGKPELCHQIVKHIIYLRRGIEVEDNWNRFCYLVKHFLPQLLKHLDARWLVSVCDTYIDHGDALQSAIAMNIVSIVQSTNIMSTIIHTQVDPGMLIERMQTDVKYPTWGGLITCDIVTGDTIHNMMTRMDNIISQDHVLNQIWCTIKDMARDNDSIPQNILCAQHSNPDMRKFFK